VRLVRSGNTITGYHSADGATWTQLSSATISFPTEVLVGLAVTAANNAALNTAVFDNVRVTKTVKNQPPTVSITTPSNGATFNAGANIRLIANAADSDGTLSTVEFFQGTTLINTQRLFPYDFTWTNVPAGTYILTARATDNNGAVTTSAPITITVKNNGGITGTGTGLLGLYFKKSDYEDQKLKDVKSLRLDPTINFNWGETLPVAKLDKDHYGVRWSGQVQPRYSGTYTFHVRSSGGFRLWVNNKLVLSGQAAKDQILEKAGSITLTAGQKYNLVLEFYQYDKNKKLTQIRLDWSSSQQPREVIPKSQFYPAAIRNDDDDDD
jgi:hypothetical protein